MSRAKINNYYRRHHKGEDTKSVSFEQKKAYYNSSMLEKAENKTSSTNRSRKQRSLEKKTIDNLMLNFDVWDNIRLKTKLNVQSTETTEITRIENRLRKVKNKNKIADLKRRLIMLTGKTKRRELEINELVSKGADVSKISHTKSREYYGRDKSITFAPEDIERMADRRSEQSLPRKTTGMLKSDVLRTNKSKSFSLESFIQTHKL